MSSIDASITLRKDQVASQPLALNGGPRALAGGPPDWPTAEMNGERTITFKVGETQIKMTAAPSKDFVGPPAPSSNTIELLSVQDITVKMSAQNAFKTPTSRQDPVRGN